jgi:hypothetical protein
MLFIGITPAFSFSDQTTSERILQENKEFIEFMNICVTNFGKDRIPDVEKKFLDVYQYHFSGQIGYLQSDYKNAFHNVRLSQKKHMGLCSEVIQKVYLEDAKVLLDRLAPEIIKSKNARARLYLTLGYRDRSVGRNFEIVSDASNPKLYSYKIFRYIEGIKLARRAKRYGLLSLYESRDNKAKRVIFENLLSDENKAGNRFFKRFAGKQDKEVIQEMNRPYEDIVKWEEAQPKTDQQAAKEKEANIDEPFESNVDRRVRYRKEKMVAKNLLYSEFERAEDVIREYVRDFNFKLIYSTIRVMERQPAGDGEKIDYSSYMAHHFDNYSRVFDAKSVADLGAAGGDRTRTLLEKLTPQVKVVGDLRREDASAETDRAGKPAENTGKGEGDKTAK